MSQEALGSAHPWFPWSESQQPPGEDLLSTGGHVRPGEGQGMAPACGRGEAQQQVGVEPLLGSRQPQHGVGG